MLARASKFMLITLLICIIGITIAKPKGDDDSDTPGEADTDTSPESAPDEKIEDASEKAIEKELEKIVDETVSEMAPVVSEMMEAEKEYLEKVTEEIPVSEQPSEPEEKSDTNEEGEEESKIEPPEVKPESTLGPVVVINTGETTIEKEEAPKDTFAVWTAKGKICLLAKFHAVFSIMYSSHRGEEKAEVTIPKTANAKGKCGSHAKLPLLQLSWGKYAFTMMFNKTDDENWAVSSLELTYDTAEPLFDGAVNAGKKTARSKPVTLFETPLKKSYLCPAQEVTLLYAGNKQAVTVRIRDLQLQPFEVENGNFSPFQRCNKVVMDDDTPYVQDETVPFAVGCTLALITLIILVGFSIHRAYLAAKVDYNSME